MTNDSSEDNVLPRISVALIVYAIFLLLGSLTVVLSDAPAAAIYGATVLTITLSLVFGQALFVALRLDHHRHLSAAVGLSLLVVAASYLVDFPGHHKTALVTVLIAAVAALVFARRSLVLPSNSAMVGAGIAIALASIPFAVAGQFGMLGSGELHDQGLHAAYTHALAMGDRFLTTTIPADYSVGAHMLAAMFSGSTDGAVLLALSGVMLAVPAITLITSLHVLKHQPWLVRVPASLLVALPYLIAVQHSRGAFKEALVGGLLVAFALVLRAYSQQAATPLRLGAVAGVLAAASALVNGITMIAWFGGALVLWALAELIFNGSETRRVQFRGLLTFSLGAAVSTIALLLPKLKEMLSFTLPYGGGFLEDISAYEVFGLWPEAHMTVIPTNLFFAGMIGAVAVLCALVAGLVLSDRKEFSIPAVAVACVMLYIGARHRANGYLAAKALTVAAPAMMLMLVYALGIVLEFAKRRSFATVGVYVATTMFLVGAGYSTINALTHGTANPQSIDRDLASIRSAAHGRPTLYLGNTLYTLWNLRGTEPGSPPYFTQTAGAVDETNIHKPWIFEPVLVDIDSLPAAVADVFDYVVTTKSSYASHFPSNWSRELTTDHHYLWKRVGPSSQRFTLNEPATTGAVLDCETRRGRQLSEQQGSALVRSAPILGAGWIDSVGGATGGIVPGEALSQRLRLPRGTWNLSMQYRSATPLMIRRGLRASNLPGNLDILGPYWSMGDVESTGKTLVVKVSSPRRHLPVDVFVPQLGQLVAVRTNDAETIPLQAACGRFVDWFTLDNPRSPAAFTPGLSFGEGFWDQEYVGEHTARWMQDKGELKLTNPETKAQVVHVNVTLQTGTSRPSNVTFTWAHGQRTLPATEVPGDVSFKLELPPGQTTVSVTTDAPPVTTSGGDARDLRVRMTDLAID